MNIRTLKNSIVVSNILNMGMYEFCLDIADRAKSERKFTDCSTVMKVTSNLDEFIDEWNKEVS